MFHDPAIVPTLVCVLCGSYVQETFRYPSGAVKWSCECGRTHGYHGVEGALDIGIIRDGASDEG